MKRLRVCLLASVFLGTSIALPFGGLFAPANAQVPDLPPPPAQAEPALGAISPTLLQACYTEGDLFTLPQTLAAFGGVPDPGIVLDPVHELSPLRIACAYIGLYVLPPRCSLDQEVPRAPLLAVTPAANIAQQIRAIEKALNAYGAPVGTQLSDPVYDQLGCTGKR